MAKKVKRTRNPEKTRGQILEVAFRQIYRNGYQGVSIDDILSETELTKGAFFHHFANKQALGYALVDETLKRMVTERWIAPLEQYENPLTGITDNLKKIIEAMPEESLALGCPLNNLIQEMSSVDPVFKDKLTAVLEYWIEGVELNLKKARQAGYLKKDAHTRRLAEFIVMNHEGAFGMMKSFRDKKVFRSLHAMLKDYLQTLAA